ncbi:MAG: MFS transporter [Thermoproteota archaeon]
MASDADREKLKWMYGRSFVSSLSNGMISPFIYVYAARIGVSSGEIGWMHSFNNFFTNSLQVPWGRLSDRIGRRVIIIVATSLLASLLWIPIALITEPKFFLVLVALQFLLASASVPAWNALLRESTQAFFRSIAVSNINIASLLGSLIATVFSGWIIDSSGGKIIIPSIIATILGLAGALILLKVKEKEIKKPRSGSLTSIFKITDIPGLINENNDFKLFLKLSAIYGFSMSLAWPIFTITTAVVLNLSMTEVGALSVIQTVATLLVQPLMGRLVTRIGKKPLIVFNYVALTTVPLVYCFASSFLHIAVLNTFLGLVVAAGNASILPHILDILPENHVGEFTSIYNMVMGLAYFTGSAIGGNAVEIMSQYLGRGLSLQVGYLISASGRLVIGLSFLKIRETGTAKRILK